MLCWRPGTSADGPGAAAAVISGSAYLKISDGCDAPLHFLFNSCLQGRVAQPSSGCDLDRGATNSSPAAPEIILIGQEHDRLRRRLGQADGLPGLMEAILEAVPGLVAAGDVRLPGRVSQRLVEVMAARRRVSLS